MWGSWSFYPSSRCSISDRERNQAEAVFQLGEGGVENPKD
jgi:hypothetical protein